jgi:drug/metabolite transporter (DMT)-like permease
VTRGWIPFATLLVLFWGVWGAYSALPSAKYGYPDEMTYVVWALTMIAPALVARRRQRFDHRGRAAIYGLINGLAGAGGQLILFMALTMGPAYVIFPITAMSPAITVLMAMTLLRERVNKPAVAGLVVALIAIVLLSITSGEAKDSHGPWLILAMLVTAAWGIQVFIMRKAATVGCNDATIFGWMAIGGLLLTPIALLHGTSPSHFPWQATALTAGIQLLNAIGALFLVMALGRGKATVVAPTTNALAPALTVAISLVADHKLPTLFGAVGSVLALAGSALIVYGDEKRSVLVTARSQSRDGT